MLPGLWRRHFLPLELALGIVIAAGVAIWSERFAGQAVLASYLDQDRATIYGTIATITAALLGFLIATVTIIYGLVAGGPGSRSSFARLRASSQYQTLWRVFRWAIRALAATTAMAIIGQAVDRDKAPIWPAFYLTLGGVLIASTLLARSIWVLEQVLTIAMQPEA
jgi:hypothetical protein